MRNRLSATFLSCFPCLLSRNDDRLGQGTGTFRVDLVFEDQSLTKDAVPSNQDRRGSSYQEVPMDREGSSQQSRKTLALEGKDNEEAGRTNEHKKKSSGHEAQMGGEEFPQQATETLALGGGLDNETIIFVTSVNSPTRQNTTGVLAISHRQEPRVLPVIRHPIDDERLSLSYLLQTNYHLLRLAAGSIFMELTSSPNHILPGNTHGSNLMSLTDYRFKETMEVETQTDSFLDYIAIQTESTSHPAIQSIKYQGSPPHPAIQSQNSIPSNTGPKNDTDKSLRKSNSENDIKSKQNDPSIQVAQSAIIGGITALGIGLIVSAPIVPLVVAIGVGFVVGGIIGHEMSFQAKKSQEREAKLGEFEKPPPQTSSKSGDKLAPPPPPSRVTL